MADSPIHKDAAAPSSANARTAAQMQAAADANHASQRSSKQQQSGQGGQSQTQAGGVTPAEKPAAQQSAELRRTPIGPPPPLQNQHDTKPAPK